MASPFAQLLRPTSSASCDTSLSLSHPSSHPSSRSHHSTFKVNLEFNLSSPPPHHHSNPGLPRSPLSPVALVLSAVPLLLSLPPVGSFPPWSQSNFFLKHKSDPATWMLENLQWFPISFKIKVSVASVATRPYLIRTPLLSDLDHGSSLLALPRRLHVYPRCGAFVPTVSSALDAPSPPPRCPHGSPWFLCVSVPYRNAFPGPSVSSVCLLLCCFHQSTYSHLTYQLFLHLLFCCLSSPLDFEFLVSRGICLLCWKKLVQGLTCSISPINVVA